MTENWKRWSDIPANIIIEKRRTINCKYCEDNAHIIYCFYCKDWHCTCKHICCVCCEILQNKRWKYQQCECGGLVCYDNCKNLCFKCNKIKCNNCFKIIQGAKKLCIQCANYYCVCDNIDKVDCYQKCKICSRYICVECAKVWYEPSDKYYCLACIHAKLIAGHNYLLTMKQTFN